MFGLQGFLKNLHSPVFQNYLQKILLKWMQFFIIQWLFVFEIVDTGINKWCKVPDEQMINKWNYWFKMPLSTCMYNQRGFFVLVWTTKLHFNHLIRWWAATGLPGIYRLIISLTTGKICADTQCCGKKKERKKIQQPACPLCVYIILGLW